MKLTICMLLFVSVFYAQETKGQETKKPKALSEAHKSEITRTMLSVTAAQNELSELTNIIERRTTMYRNLSDKLRKEYEAGECTLRFDNTFNVDWACPPPAAAQKSEAKNEKTESTTPANGAPGK